MFRLMTSAAQKAVTATRHGVAAAAAIALALGWPAGSTAQVSRAVLPLEPTRERGASITPAYEGWYELPDGSFGLLVGYYNRNTKEELEIPVGPNNRIEPGNPDQGQPTHFDIGRQWGVFVLRVPKDFGNKTLTWTIVSNGETQSIPFGLNKAYTITPLKERAMGNAPPALSFSEAGPKFAGPPTSVAATLTGKVKEPVVLNVWAEDPKGPEQQASKVVANLTFRKVRGPGRVSFDKPRISVSRQHDVVTATATFDQPGDYVLRVQANDESGEGGGGFQCCWTNAYVKVTIK